MSGVSRSKNPSGFWDVFLDRLSLISARSHNRPKAGAGAAAGEMMTEVQPLPPSRRLVVILPDANIDVVTLPKQICELAAPGFREVLLVSRPEEVENDFLARMNLATLAAILREPRVVVQTELVFGQSLETAVLQLATSNDVLVCLEDHQVRGLFKRKKLAQLLAEKTLLPVYTLKGDVIEERDQAKNHLADVLILLVCLLTLVAFFAIEVWIDRNSSGTLHSVMQVLAMVIEVWAVGAIASRSIHF